VSIVSSMTMNLVPVMCPCLEQVYFTGDKIMHNDNLSPEDVGVLFAQPANSSPNCWANVYTDIF
jgi:hypothetical protein